MSKAIAVAGICFSTWLAFAQKQTPQPLNAKTGLWEITQTVTWTGLPPQYAAMMKNGQPKKYTSCIRAKDLNSNPWAEPEHHCAWTVLKSNGTDMELRGASCQLEDGSTADAHGTIHLSDSEHGTGTFDLTLTNNGQTIKGHSTYTGKWLGATCTQ
jgi:hypothetical protein